MVSAGNASFIVEESEAEVCRDGTKRGRRSLDPTKIDVVIVCCCCNSYFLTVEFICVVLIVYRREGLNAGRERRTWLCAMCFFLSLVVVRVIAIDLILGPKCGVYSRANGNRTQEYVQRNSIYRLIVTLERAFSLLTWEGLPHKWIWKYKFMVEGCMHASCSPLGMGPTPPIKFSHRKEYE